MKPATHHVYDMHAGTHREDEFTFIPAESYTPVLAATMTFHRPVGPVGFDCVQLAIVRDGSAFLYSAFGQKPVKVGDAILLCANTLCGCEPEGHITVTTIYMDTDYVIDQVFWQHVGLLSDRLDARELVGRLYVEPAQVLRLCEARAGLLMPWLDELVRLSAEGQHINRFHRIQALWYLLADVIAPFIKISPIRLSPSQRERIRANMPRHRRFVPLRVEARRAADLLREDVAHHWSMKELADRVHLSVSQLKRVFTQAYGKTPLAFLTMLRVEELARLLRETDLLVEDAKEQVGWQSMSHAIRVFHHYTGITPGTYRNSYNTVA